MKFADALNLLQITFNEVKDQHTPVGHTYIKTHWLRYAHLIARLPTLSKDHRVLEVGASILSSLVRRRFACVVDTVYHELEPEWPERLNRDGIVGYPAELIRDKLPGDDASYDCVLFNEVMEHLPIAPDFLMRQVLAKLKPGGTLLFSVPNFATSEKRLALLWGRNPQVQMDGKYVYYAHHREPVMGECVELINRCGGLVRNAEWSDCNIPPDWFRAFWQCLRHLRHGKMHRILHQLIPSMRATIIIQATRNNDFDFLKEGIPPLVKTGEFIGI